MTRKDVLGWGKMYYHGKGCTKMGKNVLGRTRMSKDVQGCVKT